jgi:Flp pilus assembly protein TadB
MKKRLGLIAIICLLAGLAAGGFAVWSYFRAQTQNDIWPKLQHESYELEAESDAVKGRPEEKRLVEESRRKQQEADETLANAKSNSRLAVVSGVASIALILAAIAVIVLNLKKRAADSS